MKKYFILFAAAGLVLTACNENNNKENDEVVAEAPVADSSYGAAFTTEGAVTVADLNTQMAGKDSLENITVQGEISEVCQKMGCWVKFKNDGGEDIFVKFDGHDFFVPKGDGGKEAIVHGKAIREVTPVDELQHYLEDAGASEEEIAAVTEPKEEIKIVATGIIVKN